MKKTVKAMLITAAAAVTMMMVFMLTGCGTKTIDLAKYVSVEFSGYDGYGTAVIKFDDNAFVEDNMGKVSYKSTDKDEMKMLNSLGNEAKDQIVIYALRDLIGCKLDNSSNLSNGDVVTVTWNNQDEEAAEVFNVQFTATDIPFTVNGLEKVVEFDPFEGLNINASGTSPDGELSVKSDRYTGMYFNVSKTNGLSNGETVTISINDSYDVEYMIAQYGGLPSRTEMTYTVDGLAYYVTDVDEIPTDIYDKMDKQLKDVFYSNAANNWTHGGDEIRQFELIGNYILTLKEGANASPYNYLYYVYRVTIETEDGTDFTYYWYGYFQNIMFLADGTCTVDISNYTASTSSSFFGYTSGDYLSSDKHHYVAGFAEIESLFNKQIVSKIADYEYKSTINEGPAGETTNIQQSENSAESQTTSETQKASEDEADKAEAGTTAVAENTNTN